MQARRLIQGTAPLLISIPHMGVNVPADIKKRMTRDGLRLADTDWHVDRLYDFAVGMGASVLMPAYSRYVIDLNRPENDESLYPGQVKTGLCPLETFDGHKIYKDGEEPDAIEKANRIGAYWMPYHDTLQAELARIKSVHGRAVLYDAHSIKSEAPRLFDGRLPDLNLGTAKGASCDEDLAQAALAAASSGNYSAVLNGRFVGGHITRHYGRPAGNIHAIQMELAQVNYMDEETFAYLPEKAEMLREVLRRVVTALLDYSPSNPA
jgi:N-formylglutamate amidohydrolase